MAIRPAALAFQIFYFLLKTGELLVERVHSRGQILLILFQLSESIFNGRRLPGV
jgi:hypothetical protein